MKFFQFYFVKLKQNFATGLEKQVMYKVSLRTFDQKRIFGRFCTLLIVALIIGPLWNLLDDELPFSINRKGSLWGISVAEAAETIEAEGYTLTDITDKTSSIFFGLRYNRITRTYFGFANITNTSDSSHNTPIVMVFD